MLAGLLRWHPPLEFLSAAEDAGRQELGPHNDRERQQHEPDERVVTSIPTRWNTTVPFCHAVIFVRPAMAAETIAG